MSSQDKHFNFERLDAYVGGNEEVKDRLVGIFLRTAPDILKSINDSYKNNDLRTMSFFAHKFKSSIDIFNIEDLKTKLSEKFQDFTIREISNLGTGEQIAFIVEVNAEPDQIKPILEDFLGKELNDENSSIEFTGSSLSEGFYKQLRLALILAFLLMSVVVFIIFRKLTPALSIVLAALSDIIMTLTLVNILGISLSSAGIIAFLMLIGYSVDSNILLTTRVVREKHDRLNKRIFSAFKTGITMTLTSIAAVVVSLIIIFNFSNILRQIFTILTIGLCFDLINTWILNAGILKFYMKKEE